ncbi:MAG: RDD family protein [Armatimonadota bacterium]
MAVVCPDCGENNSDQAVTCTACGRLLRQDSSTSISMPASETPRPRKAVVDYLSGTVAPDSNSTGEPETSASHTTDSVQPIPRQIYENVADHHAGFFLRFIAMIVDVVILGILAVLIAVLTRQTHFITQVTWQMPVSWYAYALAIMLLYGTVMESSGFQGTLGKMALGLVVTDLFSQRVSFGTALLRNLGKILLGIMCIFAYLAIDFTEKKQGLHDLITGCLVEKRVRF